MSDMVFPPLLGIKIAERVGQRQATLSEPSVISILSRSTLIPHTNAPIMRASGSFLIDAPAMFLHQIDFGGGLAVFTLGAGSSRDLYLEGSGGGSQRNQSPRKCPCRCKGGGLAGVAENASPQGSEIGPGSISTSRRGTFRSGSSTPSRDRPGRESDHARDVCRSIGRGDWIRTRSLAARGGRSSYTDSGESSVGAMEIR